MGKWTPALVIGQAQRSYDQVRVFSRKCDPSEGQVKQ